MGSSRPRIGVFGAGAIGCWLGGRLAASGADVVLVGRARLREEIAAHGLSTVDLDGTTKRVDLAVEPDASALAACDVVLVCVKSAQTAEAADTLARVLRPSTVVASMQNGVRNADVLRERLPRALGGIVGFNVVSKGEGTFRRATSGPLVVEDGDGARAIVAAFERAGMEAYAERDIARTQWSKLVMNLNNAVSALSNAPTREIVLSAGYRRCVAAIVSEALDVMRVAGVRPKRIGPLPVAVFPYALRLPTPLIRVVARAQLRIDPEARSSMWEDLARGRPTEVDFLNGEIVRLARSIGRPAPVNARVVALIHDVEARGAGSPGLSPDALWSALHGASLATVARVHDVFERAGVRYGLFGGFAVDFHLGEPARLHDDVDVAVDPRDLARAEAALVEAGFRRLRGDVATDGFATFERAAERVDLASMASWPDGAFDGGVLAIGRVRASVIARAALVADKSEPHGDERARQKDAADLERLRAAPITGAARRGVGRLG